MSGIADIRAAVIGTGFIGTVHVEQLRRIGVQVRGVLGSTLERGQVRVHGGRGGQADRQPDLAHRGRVAPLPHLGVDELEDLALPGGEVGCELRHGSDGITNARSGQTPVRKIS